jgi:hypothetical protein
MKIENPVSILVRRRAAIGDVVMATGVVRELKNRYGKSSAIDVATDNFEVFRNNPHIRNIIPADAADPGLYSVYINLDDAYEINPENHYVDSYFYRAFGNQHASTVEKLYLPTTTLFALVEVVVNIAQRDLLMKRMQ